MEFETWVLNSVLEIFDGFKYGLIRELTSDKIIDPIRKTDEYLKNYVNQVMAYSMGVAGLEIIRRTVGDAKVLELNTMDTNDRKLWAERLLIGLGISFIKERNEISTGEDIINVFNELILEGE